MNIFRASTNDLHIDNLHVNMPNFLLFDYNQYMVVVDSQLVEPIELIYKPDHPNEDNHILVRRQMAERTRCKIYIIFDRYRIFLLTPVRLSSVSCSDDAVWFDWLILFLKVDYVNVWSKTSETSAFYTLAKIDCLSMVKDRERWRRKGCILFHPWQFSHRSPFLRHLFLFSSQRGREKKNKKNHTYSFI